jgi:hypothetical protein
MSVTYNKKIAAALAAVDLYLEVEKSEVREPLVLQETFKFEHKQSPWAVFGRMQSMNIRSMWQSKLYR